MFCMECFWQQGFWQRGCGAYEADIDKRHSRMLDPILELRGGSVYYPGGKQALKQVSAAFYPGEKTAVIGNNGAGKSTFFQNS
mgnify:CR=1 FL=1